MPWVLRLAQDDSGFWDTLSAGTVQLNRQEREAARMKMKPGGSVRTFTEPLQHQASRTGSESLHS
jgi:hypothetical protein